MRPRAGGHRRSRPRGHGEPLNPTTAAYNRLNPRMTVLAGVVAGLFVILAGGLAWRQLVRHSTYEELEQKQILRRVLQPGQRGDILDRKGRVLVGNAPHYSVVLYVDELRLEFQTEFLRLRREWLDQHQDDVTEARPTTPASALNQQARRNVVQTFLDQANDLMEHPRQAFDDEDDQHFELHFQKNLLLPFTLVGNISPEDYARFNARMPVKSPMQTRLDAVRFYPFDYGALAAHTLGWVSNIQVDFRGYDLPGADLNLPSTHDFSYRGKFGKDGLEASYDDVLKGEPGGEIWVVDPSGFKSKRIESKTPTRGGNLTCSLDIDIQRAAEKALTGNIGAAVALDVRTGEVLAMACKPDFDLNVSVPEMSYDDYTNIKAEGDNTGEMNRASEGLYPPGSTFKLVDSIAGLSANIINKDTIMDCGPGLLVGNRVFKEDRGYPNGVGPDVDFVKALALSSNVFFYVQGLKIGPAALAAEAWRLGLGSPTGIDIRETRYMKVPDPAKKEWTEGDTANFAIGQGALQVSPLQMACLVASIARQQTRTRPTLFHDPEANAAKVNAGGEALGLTPDEYALLIDGMEHCVSNTGTGKPVHAVLPDIRIAGKTGTAQRPSHGKDLTMAWFVGFAPIDHPRIAVAVAIESTEVGQNFWGGTTAGPVAAAMLKEYFKQYPEAKTP